MWLVGGDYRCEDPYSTAEPDTVERRYFKAMFALIPTVPVTKLWVIGSAVEMRERQSSNLFVDGEMRL